MKKSAFFTILSFLLFSNFFVFANAPLREIDLSKTKPNWQSVIGGKTIAPIAENSYGFSILTDGRIISSCTSKGDILWQNSIKGKPTNYFVSWGDFIYVVTNKSVLNLINPSGKTVWSVDCKFEVTAQPHIGYDGRIFVQGKENLSCYGINGGQKGAIKTELQKKLPLQELNDGSLLIFKQKLVDGKSVGVRISPFGELLEEITFVGEIFSAKACPQGVLLTFTKGELGLVSVKNNSAISMWVQKDNDFNDGEFKIITADKESCFFYNQGSSLKIQIIENNSGKLKNSFYIDNFKIQNLQAATKTNLGFFIADNKNAFEFDIEGNIYFKAELPNKSKWNYIFYTKNCQILLCMTNWTLNSYTMNQSVSGKSKNPSINKKSYIQKNKHYSPTLFELQELNSKLDKMNIGVEEEKILYTLKNLSNKYLWELNQNSSLTRDKDSLFSNSPLYTNVFFEALCKTQTDNFSSYIVKIILEEKDFSVKNNLIQNVQNLKYDKNGELLNAFLILSESKIQKQNQFIVKSICDSTYEIVKFMGRPALYKQGKTILSNFFLPSYTQDARDYARKTFEKIIELEM